MTSHQNKIELLAPARTADSGIIAVNFGADAVYIGAPAFSARSAAGNSVPDIARLVSYAHRYYVRVFVALNTILFDHELDEVEKMIWQLHEAGVDALIIQDMGILQMSLPPVEIHASTQTNNYQLSRIKFLESAGFRRIVLARELTLEQIREIRKHTTVELECFVHGALCVSLSGQCYMSEAQGGRSGNRGVCAQPCRKLYDLVDAQGNLIVQQKHLLSLKDLDLSDHITDMALAGVSSFKIEGRLKDDSYLKNITAYYRRRLDAFLSDYPDFTKASSGNARFDFNPDPGKTFSRGTSSYFLTGRTADIIHFDTPKSAGQRVGVVQSSKGNRLIIKPEALLGNNDGISFFNARGELEGVKVNVADGTTLTLARNVEVPAGTKLYRNYDHAFTEILKNSKTERKVRMRIQVSLTEDGLIISGEDEDRNTLQLCFSVERIPAMKKEKAENLLRAQMLKSGDTIFDITEITINWDEPLFIPLAGINHMRRLFLREFLANRVSQFTPNRAFVSSDSCHLPFRTVDFTENVSNRLARAFYRNQGAETVEPALEVSKEFSRKRLMTMKHCLKYQLGNCPGEPSHKRMQHPEPLFLVDGSRRFRIEFDCVECRMNVYHL